jgi:hypothetical protein
MLKTENKTKETTSFEVPPIKSSTIIGGAGSTKRKESDFYPTPEKATIALIDFLNIPLDVAIWEPACGEGHISKVFDSRSYSVISTDLIDRGYGEGDVNFLTHPVKMGDWVVTNPPFTLASQFIEKCIDFDLDGFAIFLKSQYWHASSRTELFEDNPPSYVLPLNWRPSFLEEEKGKSPTMDFSWMVWQKGATDTRYRILRRP